MKARKSEGGAGKAAFGGGSRHSGSKTIKDPRFASIHTDPRFRKAHKRETKVVIDSRFSHIFTGDRFAATKARIDKRGRHKEDSSQNRLKDYYHLDEEADESLKRSEKLKNKDAEREEEEEEEEIEESRSNAGQSESQNEELEKGNLVSESDNTESEEGDEEEEEEAQSDSSSSTSTTDSDEDDIYSDEEDTFMQEEVIETIEKETHRLAVVGMDWGRVKADDIYVLLSSFLPKGGHIKSVAVYPTEFGLKRMEEEAVHGPVGLFDEDNEKNKNSDDDDDDDDEIENEKLRKYELSRLRYYCAVVVCDSVSTADHLYKNCDGVEFERTSNKLDLRFIPDSMEFKQEPRDVTTEAPASYEGLDFHTRALQHSNVELTWDEDEPQRIKTLKRKFNADQLAELELKEFLASDDSDEADGDDENDEDSGDRATKKPKRQEKYRALLESGNGSDASDKDDDREDMEVTFNTGLEDLSKRILEKKDKQSESVWEAHLRKRREKKNARKNRSKDSSEDETSDDYQEHLEEPDDFFVEEHLDIKNKDKKGKRAGKGKPDDQGTAQENEASLAELELLLADENGAGTNLKGYNLKRKKGKDRKQKGIIDEDKIPTMDYEDPRFSNFFKSPLFALDPTDPQFKRSAVYARQMFEKHQETVKGKEKGGGVESPKELKATAAEELPPPSSEKDKHEISYLVKCIKMKSKQIQLPSSTNKVTKNKVK